MVATTGPTWTEAHRHACEVRFVCSLPRAARQRYINGDGDRARPLAAIRGQAATDRLVADVRAAWAERKQAGKPQLPEGMQSEEGRGTAASGEQPNAVPDSGSFLAPWPEGPFRRCLGVESEGSA